MIELRAKALPVRQQGDRGTCVGFAAAAAHELLRDEEEILSPEDVMWAAHELMGRTAREETSVELALFGLAGKEEAIEDAWPYGKPRWDSGRPELALQAANRRELPGWRRLQDMSIPSICTELRDGFAVILTLGVVKPVWLDPLDGVIDAPPDATVRGNHAVVAIGASEMSETMQHIRIRNSWGHGWAEGGYASVSERYLSAFGVCAHSLRRTP